MCRAGGRRCPGQYDPAKAAARNAKRRAQRAAQKNAGGAGSAHGGVQPGEMASQESNTPAPVNAHEAAMAAMREGIAALPDHSGEERSPGKRAEEMEEYSPLTDLDIDNPYFVPEGMEAHRDGREHLRDAYYALSAVASEAARQDIIRQQNDDDRHHYTRSMRTLTDRFYMGEMKDYSGQDYSGQADWDRTEFDATRAKQSIALGEQNLQRFSSGEHSCSN